MNYKTIKQTLKSAGLTLAGTALGYLPFVQPANAEEANTRALREDLKVLAASLMQTQKPLFHHGFGDGLPLWFYCTKDYNPPQAENPENVWMQYETEFKVKDRFGNSDYYSVTFFDLQPFHSIGKEDILRLWVTGRSMDYGKWDGLGTGIIFAIDNGLNGIDPGDNTGKDDIRPHQTLQYVKDGKFDYSSWQEDQLKIIEPRIIKSKRVKK